MKLGVNVFGVWRFARRKQPGNHARRNLQERKLSSAPGDLTYEGIVGIVVDYQGIGGLVVEYVVAIHVTRVRFPADALFTRQRDMTCNMLQAIVNVKSFE